MKHPSDLDQQVVTNFHLSLVEGGSWGHQLLEASSLPSSQETEWGCLSRDSRSQQNCPQRRREAPEWPEGQGRGTAPCQLLVVPSRDGCLAYPCVDSVMPLLDSPLLN